LRDWRNPTDHPAETSNRHTLLDAEAATSGILAGERAALTF
jgi:hypothetical protein